MKTGKFAIERAGAHRYVFTRAGTYHFTVQDVQWGSLKDFKLTIERPGIGELDARECLPGEEEHFDFGVDVKAGDELAIWVKHAVDAYKEGAHGGSGEFNPEKDGVGFYSDDFRIALELT